MTARELYAQMPEQFRLRSTRDRTYLGTTVPAEIHADATPYERAEWEADKREVLSERMARDGRRD